MTDPNQSATEPSEGKTPRTDEAQFWARFVDQTDHAPPHELMVDVDFTRQLERENQSLRKAAEAARDLLAFIQDADVKACAAMVQMGIPLEPESYEIQNRITPALAELRAKLEPTPEVP